MRWISLISSGHSIPNENALSQLHMTYHRIHHTLGHKSNLSKFKKVEVLSSIFSDHNALRLNYKTKTVKNTNTWRLSNTFLNNQQVTEEINKEIRNL